MRCVREIGGAVALACTAIDRSSRTLLIPTGCVDFSDSPTFRYRFESGAPLHRVGRPTGLRRRPSGSRTIWPSQGGSIYLRFMVYVSLFTGRVGRDKENARA